MTVTWSFPTEIVFGEGTASEVGPKAKALGAKQVLLVTDAGVRDAGVSETVLRSLQKAGLTITAYDQVSAHPTQREVEAATAAFGEAKADVVVAVGGGAPVDVGKLVRVLSSHDVPLEELDEAKGGDQHIQNAMPPMIAVPTTAGPGSEVGRASMVTLDSGARTLVFSPRLIPDVAVLDPKLTVSLPPDMTAATGFDALTHCIEAYCAKGDHPMADALSLMGIELIATHLPEAVEEGSNLEARGGMMKAAMMGAVATQKGLGAVSALAQALTTRARMHRGLATALCLPAVLDFNRSGAPTRIAGVARRLGVKGQDTETLAFECSGKVRSLRKQLGLPQGLAEAGVREDALGDLATLAMADPAHQTNPRACTKEHMLSLYRASL